MLQSLYFRNCNEQHTLLITQYREMKKEWKENIYLARSKIQGLGLYAKRDLDMNQMIIEYLGEMIRNEVNNGEGGKNGTGAKVPLSYNFVKKHRIRDAMVLFDAARRYVSNHTTWLTVHSYVSKEY